MRAEDKMIYEFIVDTKFISAKEITYDEVCMCKDIIDILEKNRNFVLRRFKKYTIEEYEQEQIEFSRRQEQFIKFLDLLLHTKKELTEYVDYEFVEDKIDIEEGEV